MLHIGEFFSPGGQVIKHFPAYHWSQVYFLVNSQVEDLSVVTGDYILNYSPKKFLEACGINITLSKDI